MKRVKYFICFLLIGAGFLFNGELFILHLDNFQESYYRSSFAFLTLSKEIEDEQIIKDFLAAGDKWDVDFFMVDGKIKSTYEKSITIYGTEDAIHHLKQEGISAEAYKSLFTGSTTVQYESFENITDLRDYEDCYLFSEEGDVEDLRNFKRELIGPYGGGFPQIYGSTTETWTNLLLVWGAVCSILLLLTIYQVLWEKKEAFVRITLGENIYGIFAKNVFSDLGVYMAIFVLHTCLLQLFSNVNFKLLYVSLFFLCFLACNTFIHSFILRVRFKKDMANSYNGKSVLVFHYGIKIAATFLTIVILSGNFVLISEAMNCYKQSEFFERKGEYSFYRLWYKPDNPFGKTTEDGMVMNQTFHNRFRERSLQFVDLTENYSSPYPVLLVNESAMKEMEGEWKTLADMRAHTDGQSGYMLLPESITEDAEGFDRVADLSNSFLGSSFDDDIKVLQYDGNIELPGIHNPFQFKSTLMKNPIILYDSRSQEVNGPEVAIDGYYAGDIMYDISDTELESFVAEFQLENQVSIKTNVWEAYKRNFDILMRSMKIISVLSIFLIFIELSLIVLIIRAEYQFNSVELALKKIYGYTVFERNQRIIKNTVLTSVLGIFAVFIMNRTLGLSIGGHFVWIGLALLVVELCFIGQKSRSVEKMKLLSILKGDRL